MIHRLLAAALLLALSCNPASEPSATDHVSGRVTASTATPLRATRLTRSGQVTRSTRTHYVVLTGDSVVDRMRRDQAAGRATPVRAHRRQLAQDQARLEPAVRAAGARIIGRLTRLANALVVVADPPVVARLRRLPGIARVEAAPVYRPHLGESVPVTGAPILWQAGSDLLGRNIRVGVLDSGIDYTHAAFGGSGDPAVYQANDALIIEPGTFPTARVVDGTDLVGDLYDSGDSNHDVPEPDPDPLDCPRPDNSGHGTHVASIVGGGGVTSDGSPYSGPYNQSLDPTAFEVGPGMAPAADLYAIKVFGCGGSTSVITLALEWSSDPNGDGLFDDRLDVVNLSLGSKFGLGSTDQSVTENLVWLGTTVVASSGNTASDVKRARPFFVTDSPAVIHPVISVANSWKNTQPFRSLEIGGAALGPFPVSEGRDNPTLETTGTVSGPLRRPVNRNGCDPFTNASQFPGTIALIDRGGCSFNTKFEHAEAAGAVAALIIDWSGHDVPWPVTNVDAALPGGMIRTPHGEAIHAALDSGTSLTATLDAAVWWPSTVGPDYIKDSSCRGPSAWDGLLKPDLAGPGTTILAAGSGTGWENLSKSGTSMSAPHVAGAVALLLEGDAGLSPLEIKARLMSTARVTRDLQGNPFPVSLAGAGNIQVDAALNTPAYLVTLDATGTPSPLVSASWGAQVSASPFELTHTVRVFNPSAVAVSYTVDAQPFHALTGATITATPATITVAPAAHEDVTLRLSVNPAQLPRPEPDAVTPPATYPGVGRHFLVEADGLVRLTATSPATAPDLSLPYHALLRAAGQRQAGAVTGCAPSGDHTTVRVAFTDNATLEATQVTSVFVNLPGTATDPLIAFGVTHNLDEARGDPDVEPTLFFGLATAVDWLLPARNGRSAVGLDIDVDGDEEYDFTVKMDSETESGDDDFGNADIFTVRVYPYGEWRGEDYTPLRANVVDPRSLRVPVHLTSVWVLPVRVEDLELDTPLPPLGLRPWARQADEDIIDGELVTVDLATLPMDTTAGGWSAPRFGRTPFATTDHARVVLLPDFAQGPIAPELLLLHHSNEHGARVEVVSLDTTANDYEQGDLAVETAAATGLVTSGRTAAATFIVTNHGPGDLTDASLEITLLPSGVTVGDATVVTTSGACSGPDGTAPILCDLGTLAESAAVTVHVTLGVTVDQPPAGTLGFSAAVSTGLDCDAPTGNNTAQTLYTVMTPPDPPEEEPPKKKGCGCQTRSPHGLPVLMVLVVLGLMVRRRNRIAGSPVVPTEVKEHSMKRNTLAMILGVAALALTAGCSSDKKKGCTKDTDCKGERVCQKGSCVSAKAQSEDPDKDGKKTPTKGLMAALKASKSKPPGPGGSATAPGTPNAGPGTPGGSGTWKKDSIRFCLGGRCVGLGRGLGSNQKDMRAMLGMLKQLVFSGLGGMGSGKLPQMQVCVGPQCVTLDKKLLTNPMALLKLFSNFNPQMLRDLFQKILKRRSPGASPGLRPGLRPSRPTTPPRTAPKGVKAFRNFADLLKAGDAARGRNAELSKLSITSVSETRLVLEGPGREMIVLRIPATLKSLLPKLRITTSQVTVRFRVLSRPIGKLVHGELLGYD